MGLLLQVSRDGPEYVLGGEIAMYTDHVHGVTLTEQLSGTLANPRKKKADPEGSAVEQRGLEPLTS